MTDRKAKNILLILLVSILAVATAVYVVLYIQNQQEADRAIKQYNKTIQPLKEELAELKTETQTLLLLSQSNDLSVKQQDNFAEEVLDLVEQQTDFEVLLSNEMWGLAVNSKHFRHYKTRYKNDYTFLFAEIITLNHQGGQIGQNMCKNFSVISIPAQAECEDTIKQSLKDLKQFERYYREIRDNIQ